MEIGWDGKIQEDAKCIFAMELQDFADFEDDDEKYYSMVWSNIMLSI